jgi:hypothetical protein
LKKKQWILGLVVLAALVGVVVWGRDRIHFDFRVFWTQLVLADWRRIAIALGCIYFGYLIRSYRWARLLRHIKQVGPLSLLGTQVIGFTGVALLGRIADPVRPYLVAKKTGLPLSNQVAVYIVERLFDFGSMALLFFSVILLAPADALPHPEVVRKLAISGLSITLAGVFFLLAVRLAGGMVAGFLEGLFGAVSKKLGQAVGHKIRSFRAGLDTMRSVTDLAVVGGLSLLMWGLIVLAYLEIIQAFVPDMTLAKCMMVMACAMASSGFQLPVVGWFTQIGLVAAALTGFFGVPAELATACSATLLLVSFLSVAPVGLVWAQFEHVSLRKVAAESELAEVELKVD